MSTLASCMKKAKLSKTDKKFLQDAVAEKLGPGSKMTQQEATNAAVVEYINSISDERVALEGEIKSLGSFAEPSPYDATETLNEINDKAAKVEAKKVADAKAKKDKADEKKAAAEKIKADQKKANKEAADKKKSNAEALAELAKKAKEADDARVAAAQAAMSEPTVLGDKHDKAAPSEPSQLENDLRSKTVAKVLKALRDRTTNPIYKALIDKMMPHVPSDITIKIVKHGEKLPAWVVKDRIGKHAMGGLEISNGIIIQDSTTGKTTIYLKDSTFLDNGINEETVLHELLHSATMELMAAASEKGPGSPTFAATERIRKLQAFLLRRFNRREKAGTLSEFERPFHKMLIANIDELVSWGLTNSDFKSYLLGIAYKKTTAWSELTSAVAKILGLSKTEHNAYLELMDAMNGLLEADFRGQAELRQKMTGATGGSVVFLKHANEPTETKAGYSVSQLKVMIPNAERVVLKDAQVHSPGPIKMNDNTEFKDADLGAKGKGLKGLGLASDIIKKAWAAALDKSPAVGRQVALDNDMNPKGFEFWDRALQLEDRARYWYEISTEGMRDLLPMLSGKELSIFFDVVGATSPQANPNDNIRRALSILGYNLSGKPAITAIAKKIGDKGGAVRSALAGVDSTTNKIHNFSGTFDFLAGLNPDAPLSTNDRQVAASFGVSDSVLFNNQSVYLPVSRFYMELRDALNSKLPKDAEPYQAWQLQALGWVQERIDKMEAKGKKSEGDDYLMAMDKIKAQAVAAGLLKKGSPFTVAVLQSPEFQKIVDTTTERFATAHITTIEAMSERSPETANLLENYKEDLANDPIAQKLLAASIKRTMTAVTTRIKKNGKKVNSLASRIMSAIQGKTVDITRIDIGEGTFRGAVNNNMRIPLIGATQSEMEQFLALFGEGLNQDFSPASRYNVVPHDDAPAPGAVRTYQIFFQDFSAIDLKAISEALPGNGHELSVTHVANGTVLDITPDFDNWVDGLPVGISYNDFTEALGDIIPDGVIAGVAASDFTSAGVAIDDVSSIINDIGRRIDRDAIGDIQKVLPNVKKSEANKILKASSIGQEISKSATKRLTTIRERRNERRSNIQDFRKEFRSVLDRQESEIKGIAERLESRRPKKDTSGPDDIPKFLRQEVDPDAKTSSYKMDAPIATELFEIETLEIEKVSEEFRRDNRLDIKAGRRVKEIDAAIAILNTKIKRSEIPPVTEGEARANFDDINETVEKLVGTSVDERSIVRKTRDWLKDYYPSWANIRSLVGRRLISQTYTVEIDEVKAFGKKLLGSLSPTTLIHQAKNALIASSVIIHQYGMKLIDKQLVIDHDQLGLLPILEMIAGHPMLNQKHLKIWEAYLIVKRSERLMAEGKENFVLEDDLQAIKDWVDARPNLKALFDHTQKLYSELNRKNLQLAVDSGWINNEDAFGGQFALLYLDGKTTRVTLPQDRMFPMDYDLEQHIIDTYGHEEGFDAESYMIETRDGWYHDDYVPFNRLDPEGNQAGMQKAGRIGQVRKGVVGLKGGFGQIPVIENMTKNIAFLVQGTMKTVAMQTTVDMYKGIATDKIEDGGVPSSIITDEQAYQSFKELDINYEEMSIEDVQRWKRMLATVSPIASDTVVVYRDGRPEYHKVIDKHLLSALKSVGPDQMRGILKVIGFPVRLLSMTITKMPAFLVSNMVRELQNAFAINEKGSFNPLVSFAKGFANFARLLKKDNADMMSMIGSGSVSFNSYYKTAPDEFKSELNKMAVNKSAMRKIVESPFTTMKSLWDFYIRVAAATENANRLTVRNDYIRSQEKALKKEGVEKGTAAYIDRMNNAVAEGNYRAMDVLNFSRRGEGLLADLLIATMPFVNPRIQGLDRLYRGAKENPGAMLIKAGMMTAAATALALWNWDENEEEMDKLKEEDKDLWYHFFIDTGGEKKEHFRIPKGFEIGQITGTLPERIIEQAKTDMPEPVFKSFKRFVHTTVGLSYPQPIKPILEVAMNEDSFRNRPIVSFGQQFLIPQEQYSVYTSKLIVEAAQNMPDSAPEWAKSPAKLQHLFKGYLGPMGAMALEGANDIYQETGNAPDAPSKNMGQRYLVRNFLRSDERSSRNVNRMYEMLSEVGEIATTLNHFKKKDRSKVSAFYQTHAEKIRTRKALNKMSKRMSNMSKQVRAIIAHPTMGADDKASEIQRLTIKKNELAKLAVEKYWKIFN